MPDALRARIEGKMAIHSARGGYAPSGMYGTRDAGRSMDIRSGEARAAQAEPLVVVNRAEITRDRTGAYFIEDIRRELVETYRSDDRRVGKECVRTFTSRWSRYYQKKNPIT